MSTLRNLAIVIAALTALGTAQAQASLPLQSIALHVNNLRPGYTVITAIYHPQAFMAQQYHVRIGQLTYFGWLNSYEVLYARRDRSGLGEVGNKLDRYSSFAGAHWGYRLAIQNTLCCGKYHAIAMPQVGDESTGFLAASGGRGFIGIKFRQGSYVADVAILPGNKRPSLLLLARLVDQRIRLFG
ncbi:MAG: hypothetical protein PVSMB7_16870 [Chloroflexota bacterium]